MDTDNKETSRTKTAVLLAIIPAAAAIAVALIQYHPWTWSTPSRTSSASRPPGTMTATTVPPVAHVEPIHMGALEPNVSRDYSDLRHFPVNSAIQCSNACLADRQCKAMTFVPYAGAGTCWLKNAVPEARTVPNDISAVKVE